MTVAPTSRPRLRSVASLEDRIGVDVLQGGGHTSPRGYARRSPMAIHPTSAGLL
jgi:hypothetical protein